MIEISKKEIPGSQRSIYGYILSYSGRMFTFCVLIRWDLNFCVHSSPLRDLNFDKRILNMTQTLSSYALFKQWRPYFDRTHRMCHRMLCLIK